MQQFSNTISVVGNFNGKSFLLSRLSTLPSNKFGSGVRFSTLGISIKTVLVNDRQFYRIRICPTWRRKGLASKSAR